MTACSRRWPTRRVASFSLLGHYVGSTLAPRLPEHAFRRLTLTVVLVARGVAALTA